MQISQINTVAAATVTGLAVVTFACGMAAVSAAATATVIAYSILAIGGGAVSVAAITAWISSRRNTTPAEYFATIQDHAMVALPAFAQWTAQRVVAGLIDGLSRAASDAIYAALTGKRHA